MMLVDEDTKQFDQELHDRIFVAEQVEHELHLASCSGKDIVNAYTMADSCFT